MENKKKEFKFLHQLNGDIFFLERQYKRLKYVVQTLGTGKKKSVIKLHTTYTF